MEHKPELGACDTRGTFMGSLFIKGSYYLGVSIGVN